MDEQVLREPSNPKYLNSSAKCPACNNAYHDAAPVYVILAALVFVFLLLGFIYVKYLLAQRENRVCQAFRQMQAKWDAMSQNDKLAKAPVKRPTKSSGRRK